MIEKKKPANEIIIKTARSGLGFYFSKKKKNGNLNSHSPFTYQLLGKSLSIIYLKLNHMTKWERARFDM